MSDFIEENRYSVDGNVHDKQRLKELQALPLERKEDSKEKTNKKQ